MVIILFHMKFQLLSFISFNVAAVGGTLRVMSMNFNVAFSELSPVLPATLQINVCPTTIIIQNKLFPDTVSDAGLCSLPIIMMHRARKLPDFTPEDLTWSFSEVETPVFHSLVQESLESLPFKLSDHSNKLLPCKS